MDKRSEIARILQDLVSYVLASKPPMYPHPDRFDVSINQILALEPKSEKCECGQEWTNHDNRLCEIWHEGAKLPLPEKEPRKECEHQWVTGGCNTYCIKCGNIVIPETPKRIEPTNLFRTIPPDNLEQVHYAFCALADKIDELIQDRNDRVIK